MKLDIEGVMMTVVSAYATQVGCMIEEKDKFSKDLCEVVDGTREHTQVCEREREW